MSMNPTIAKSILETRIEILSSRNKDNGNIIRKIKRQINKLSK